MQRRQWLTYCASAIAVAGTSSAQADDFTEFTADRYEQALASGKPFMVGFLSSW